MANAHCATLLIAATSSGQGKTTCTAALARRAVRQGRRVRVFKVGPDFIDPQVLERASGHPVYQVDGWMCGLDACRGLLHRAALDADLILVEGVMGLYDGTPSTADLARELDLPVLALVDGAAMAQTFGAIVRGLQVMPGAPRIIGAFANRVMSAGHAALLAASLPANVPLVGRLADDDRLRLPERYLGLRQAGEIGDLDTRLDALAEAVIVDDALLQRTHVFASPVSVDALPSLLEGVHIGVARDEAFTFVYPANLDTLRGLGARLTFFSPLDDARLPGVDALYLPGGYPELHAERLSRNSAMHAALRAHHASNKPMVAECGGMMMLMSALVDAEGRRFPMVDLLAGDSRMERALQAIGPQILDTPNGELRGHTFHHSKLETTEPHAASARSPLGGPAERVFRKASLTASYVHPYFPSNPRAAAGLFAHG